MKLPLCRKSLLFGSASILAMGVACSAYAWTWANYITVYSGSPGICVQGDAGIDHRKPGGFSGNLAYSAAYVRNQGCGAGLYGWWTTTRLDVYKAPPGGSGALCRGTDWKSDYTSVDAFGNPIGPQWVFDYSGAASCGPGWYGTFGGAFAWDGSAWRGGWVWSGWEWVGTTGIASASDNSPPAQPDWVDADGKVNIEKAPKEVGQFDGKGDLAKGAGGEYKKVPSHLDVPPAPLRAAGGPR